MHTLLYTVTALHRTVWLIRREQRFKLGNYSKKKNSLTLFSPKTELFIDSEDRDAIKKAVAKNPDPEVEIGCVEVLFWERPDEPGLVSLRVGGHDRLRDSEDEDDLQGPRVPNVNEVGEAVVADGSASTKLPYGRMESWFEIATWTVSRGIRFNKKAHPAFRKDADALALAANEAVQGGSGVFHPKILPGSNIFGENYLTEL